jgi:hypothetical protein
VSQTICSVLKTIETLIISSLSQFSHSFRRLHVLKGADPIVDKELIFALATCVHQNGWPITRWQLRTPIPSVICFAAAAALSRSQLSIVK